MAALYDVISGQKGQARDWNRFHPLFAPGARMIPSVKRPDGMQGDRVLTPEEYIARSEKLVVEDGFRESDLHRVVERFGPLVHISGRARWEAVVATDGGLDSRDAGPAAAREVPAAGQSLTAGCEGSAASPTLSGKAYGT